MPYTEPPNASIEITTDAMSSGALRGVVTFSIRRQPSHSPPSANGSTSPSSAATSTLTTITDRRPTRSDSIATGTTATASASVAAESASDAPLGPSPYS